MKTVLQSNAMVLHWYRSTCCFKFLERTVELKQALKPSFLCQWSIKVLSSEDRNTKISHFNVKSFICTNLFFVGYQMWTLMFYCVCKIMSGGIYWNSEVYIYITPEKSIIFKNILKPFCMLQYYIHFFCDQLSFTMLSDPLDVK